MGYSYMFIFKLISFHFYFLFFYCMGIYLPAKSAGWGRGMKDRGRDIKDIEIHIYLYISFLTRENARGCEDVAGGWI